MTDLEKWIAMDNEEVNDICPCCKRSKKMPQPGGGAINYWEDISNCY